jgi:hypothetical protein
MSLNIMVLESEPGAADEASLELSEAGHVVLRCHEPGASAFPCRGLADESTCPLHSHAVDVALTVRSRVRSQPAPAEDGVRCALMSRVPLVVAGPSALDPYDGVETRSIDRTYDVVATCEEAAGAELPAHARRAAAVLADAAGADRAARGSARVSVTRRDGGLRVRVMGLEDATRQERQAAVVRVVGALRQFDRAARTIDVAINPE